MHDYVNHFFDLYTKGDLLSAVEQIIRSPDSSYANFSTSNGFQHLMIHFIDAAVFEGTLEAFAQNFILCKFSKWHAQQLAAFPEAFNHLKIEGLFLAIINNEIDSDESIPDFFQKLLLFEKEEKTLNHSEIEDLLIQVPQTFRSLIKFHLMMALGWQTFKSSKPLFLSNFSKNYRRMHPWYPLQYALPIPSLKMLTSEKIPIIFFEPVKDDLSEFLQQLKGRTAIFAFTTVSNFFQMLQFPGFATSLCEPEHLTYILQLYPNHQWISQNNLEYLKSGEFEPIFFAPTESLQAYIPILLQALKECIATPKNDLKSDTLNGNWLYEVARRLLQSIRQKRLGMEHAPALYQSLAQVRWYDKHKGPLPADKPLGPDPNDFMKAFLSNLAKNRAVRARMRKDKVLLAHVVPQIVSGGHAPSRLLENLVLNRDPQKFEISVISTEILREFPLEYPYNFYVSKATGERGKEILYQFNQMGVTTYINQKKIYYITSAVELCHFFKEHKIDVAVFHGPDIINTMAAQMTDVPLRILFEHGSQSSFPGFDVAIVSSEAAAELYHDHYQKLNTKVIALPFAVDVRKNWRSIRYPRKFLGLPENNLVMTTISTKLDARLTQDFCHTLAEILRRVPNACYAPIGEISDPERIKKIFAEYGVADRFFPLGMTKFPSQYARSMNLYLNEFPFGGCLALLDAMAAGCPVVTMYDVNGPQQARYGGDFMGIDRAITSGNKEEYIQLACRLLTDTEMHKEWSQHTLIQYEKFTDVKGYMKAFEQVILEAYHKS